MKSNRIIDNIFFFLVSTRNRPHKREKNASHLVVQIYNDYLSVTDMWKAGLPNPPNYTNPKQKHLFSHPELVRLFPGIVWRNLKSLPATDSTRTRWSATVNYLLPRELVKFSNFELYMTNHR